MTSNSGLRYLIVGGCGFLGKYIVDYLLNRGETSVKIFDLRKTFDDARVQFVLGDITKPDDLEGALKDVDVVIHTASPKHDASNPKLAYLINVTGTQRLIEACQKCGIKRLVYTSSASVVFAGYDIKGATEATASFPKKHVDSYSHTKELAERMVLSEHGHLGLRTVALRPSGIFGPGDQQGLPGFLQVAREGKTRVQVGNGQNLFDWTYVENVAMAHVLAADKLTEGSAIGGQAYFITNDEPIPFWDMPKFLWSELGYPTPSISIPYLLLYYVAFIISLFLALLAPIKKIELTFSPLRIALAGSTRHFDISKAKKELGYKPIVSVKEGMKRTVAFAKEQIAAGKL